jgi:hypothetical protein
MHQHFCGSAYVRRGVSRSFDPSNAFVLGRYGAEAPAATHVVEEIKERTKSSAIGASAEDLGHGSTIVPTLSLQCRREKVQHGSMPHI